MSPASGDQEGLEHVLQSVSSASNSGDHEQAAGLPEVKLWNKEVLRPFLTHEKEPLNLQEPRDCPLNSATVIGPSLEPSASRLLLLDTMILLTCVLGHSLTRDLSSLDILIVDLQFVQLLSYCEDQCVTCQIGTMMRIISFSNYFLCMIMTYLWTNWYLRQPATSIYGIRSL